MKAVSLLLAALVLAACGGEPSADDVRAAVEEAAGVELRESDVGIPEVDAAYTAADKGHYIQLYVLETEEDAETMREALPTTEAGGSVRTAVNGKVFLVYTSTGADPGAAERVVEAVEGL